VDKRNWVVEFIEDVETERPVTDPEHTIRRIGRMHVPIITVEGVLSDSEPGGLSSLRHASIKSSHSAIRADMDDSTPSMLPGLIFTLPDSVEQEYVERMRSRLQHVVRSAYGAC